MKSADEILAFTEPEQAYTGDPFKAEKELHHYKIEWHPDRNKDPRATEVLLHLTNLYDKAVHKLKSGIWNQDDSTLLLRDLKDILKPFKISYYKKHLFELGEIYIGESHVTYLVRREHKDLYDNALRIIKSFKFADKDMEKEMSHYLPQILYSFDTSTHHVLILKKNLDLILLKDLNEYVDGNLDPKHVAWIMSSLYNLTCYFEYAGITHNALSLDTYWVSPEGHSGVILGGWWYALKKDEILRKLPAKTFNWIPPAIISKRVANIRIDLELIRAMGREMLGGDANKVHMVRTCGAPLPLINWVCYSSVGRALKEYQAWTTCLESSFGVRKFTKLEVSVKDVYNK